MHELCSLVREFFQEACSQTLHTLAFALFFILIWNWMVTCSSCMNSRYVNSSKRLALRHFTHWHLLYLFYFDLEVDGHMQLLHELSVRELFQEACSQTLHSHACCLNYSMEVDLCIEAVSEIYLLALPLFRSRVGVVGTHDFICKASPATLRPPCDILHQARTKKQLWI